MDKRRQPRFDNGQRVAIRTLGEHPCEQIATVRNASESGLGLWVETAIPPGSAVRIDLDDCLLLGEAMYCRSMEKGHFVGIQLEQVLRGLSELHEQFREFSDDPDGAVAMRYPVKFV